MSITDIQGAFFDYIAEYSEKHDDDEIGEQAKIITAFIKFLEYEMLRGAFDHE